MKNPRDHLSIQRIVDFLEDRLTPDERPEIEAHISVCTRCSSDLSQLRHLIRLMRSDASEDAPPSVISKAIRLFRSRTAPSNAPSRARRQIPTVLRFDSLSASPAFGIRSGKSGARQLLYYGVAFGTDLQIYEIDLRIETSGRLWVVSGQVFGGAAGGGQAKLHSDTSGTLATLNEQSEFILPPVDAGIYSLTLGLANVDVEVNELKVGV